MAINDQERVESCFLTVSVHYWGGFRASWATLCTGRAHLPDAKLDTHSFPAGKKNREPNGGMNKRNGF